MSRRPLIAGNWKLNLDPHAAAQVAGELRAACGDTGDVDVLLFPTALSIPAVVSALQGSGIQVGIQAVHGALDGAWTGANSASMARAAGCTWALAGHSERRHVFGETDEYIARQVKAALQGGVLPMLCVGETLEERDEGRVDEVVHRQLTAGFGGLEADQALAVTIAYEPVWAIGTGRTASSEQAQEVHASIRAWLRESLSTVASADIRVLYGGSVKPDNAAELLGQPDIDGVLVGGASLTASSFSRIIAAAR